MVREDTTLLIENDAQSLFYKSLWFILLTSNCTILKYSHWVRENYIPSSNPDRVLYIFFSIFVSQHYSINPDEKIDIRLFKAEMQLMKNTFHNILERVRRGFSLANDAIENGLNRFSSLVTLFDIEFDTLFSNLKDELKEDCFIDRYKLSEYIEKNQYGEEKYKFIKK